MQKPPNCNKNNSLKKSNIKSLNKFCIIFKQKKNFTQLSMFDLTATKRIC